MRCVTCLVAVLAFNSCAGRRVNQFRDFADAGRAYSEAISELAEGTAKAAIDADSAVLIAAREGLSQEGRKDRLIAHKEALQALLSVLSDLRQHTMALRRYFVSLGELAGEDAPTGIADRTALLVRELQAVSPRLASARIGDAEVSSLVGPAVPFVVGHFQRKALEAHLRAHSATLERELEIHRALVAALAASLEADAEAVLSLQETEAVARPYVLGDELPESWNDVRRRSMTAEANLSSVGQAVGAAKELKRLFLSLVENKGTPRSFSELFTDIDAVLDFIELVSTAS